MSETPSERSGLKLFGLSFLALFLELMMIRWVPSVVHLVAYYANLLLISSFLGLGLGAMLSPSRVRLFAWFPRLLVLNVGFLLLCGSGAMPTSSVETRFFSGDAQIRNYILLAGVFFLNTTTFVPLGQQIGILFGRMRPLHAYSWDLGGSLCGTLAFGLFSYLHFSPVLGMALVAVVFLVLAAGRPIVSVLLLAVVCGAMFVTDRSVAIWSPYYFVTVHEASTGADGALAVRTSDTRRVRNPPMYEVRVNHDFYQLHGTIDLTRYDQSAAALKLVQHLRDQYLLPYAITPHPRRVLVLGSGGGMDVEAALLSGAEHVDAVDIDPVLIDLGRRLGAGGVYHDPRVRVHVDDARAFLQRPREPYDLVVFGFLDSQALSSYMSNVRLDGYTYTVEGLRRAHHLVAPGGMLALSFAAGQPWLGPKLRQMLLEATGRAPLVYADGPHVILCARKGTTPDTPVRLGRFEQVSFSAGGVSATDDWPYLYLSRKTVPGDYLTVIALLLVLSIGSVAMVRERSFSSADGHFLLLGVGFLLLETKSIGDCSLYFGATWLVTTVVVAGVLLMVLSANLVALRLTTASPWLYIPLLISICVLAAVPRALILQLPFPTRLAWTLLVVPLPLFFAGLIFSTSFKHYSTGSAAAGALFGANLIGATIGGFCEYLAMATGSQRLMVIVVAAYLGSLICRLRPAPLSAPAANHTIAGL